MTENTIFSWTYFVNQIKTIGILDVIDIILVAFLLYGVYAFIRDRRAGKLAVGVGLIIIVTLLSKLIGFSALSFIMENLFQIGLLALVVVFQPEFRSALEKVGGEPLRSLRNIGDIKETQNTASPYIKEICHTAEELSKSRTGALIVIERSTKLGDIIKTGVIVNADVSSFVLRNIFYEGAPLHDGAVVIRNWRVYAAGCFLPLSKNENIIKDLGTRHRAGIGISEESDAVVIIVSEEKGTISVAVGGQLKRGYTYNSLKRDLEKELAPDNEETSKGGVTRIITQFKKEGK